MRQLRAWRIGTECYVIETCEPCWSIAATMRHALSSDPYWFGLATLNYLSLAGPRCSARHGRGPVRWTSWRRDTVGQVATYSAPGRVDSSIRDWSLDCLLTFWLGPARPVLGRDRWHCPLRGQWQSLTWTLRTLAAGIWRPVRSARWSSVSALSSGRFEVTALVDHPRSRWYKARGGMAREEEARCCAPGSGMGRPTEKKIFFFLKNFF